jgi:hypothetical protein
VFASKCKQLELLSNEQNPELSVATGDGMKNKSSEKNDKTN